MVSFTLGLYVAVEKSLSGGWRISNYSSNGQKNLRLRKRMHIFPEMGCNRRSLKKVNECLLNDKGKTGGRFV